MRNQKVIILTGASSQLGIAIKNKLDQTHIVVTDRFDITSNTESQKAMKAILKKYKRIDVLINVAGVSASGPALKESVASLNSLLEVNVISHLRLNTAAAGLMLSQKGKGRIINITSLNGLVSLPGFGIYGASKAAAESLGLSMHYELAAQGIKLTNIAPGAINFKEENKRQINHKTAREKIPLLKYLLPMTTPDAIALRISNLIESENNPGRIIVGADAKIVFALSKFLPHSIFEKIILFLWNKK